MNPHQIYRLGDPHLGRRFTKGVPLDRRGEREALVRADLNRHLSFDGYAAHITMGDLFDAPQVDYATVLFAYRAYRTAAELNPGTTYYILQGNHDDSRDLDEVTAWDLFVELVEGIPNITPVISPIVGPHFALFPWDPIETAEAMVEKASWFIREQGCTTAYGHWDVDPRTATHNLIPTKALAAAGITEAYTGHVHLPSLFKRDGVQVEVVGSMQPYAQGEDGGQGHIRYATLTLAELEAAGDLANTVVRLQLAPGEQFDGEPPACLSWNVERVKDQAEEAPADISMEGFDTRAAARDALDAHDIIPEVRAQIDERLSEVFGRDG
ncbi:MULTISPECIES: hypothetical protein [unclassified Methylobacterium]|uniref:hypothetical protein n=1 Tax=unclassified Methylobacterium TaxID=2615210 RepID=UPI0011C1FB90|nr:MULTISPECIES: hypothetical protein [unclassified Methylobacterium]QEE37956.1 hypothetical protein FVA80_02225 [Methylobacterium sp. WL1]TXN59796.1 hypothetical protein FV241_00055 [Methylobacterium sp. WL2]